ncbi:MAG: hypothetical protein Q9M94_04640 [Candidatus Gracilibacteria bacterium]|nr:hypothetical protein [Candidatus Gracilibacteria bacterium]
MQNKFKNILTVYKMNLPFGEGSYYDKTKYNSVIQDLIWFFKYENIFIEEKKEKYKEFELSEIKFSGGYIKIIFYYEKNHLFLPSFQVDLFSDIILSKKFLKKFYEIFTDIGGGNYIFDLISDKIKINSSKILTDYELAESFKTFSELKLTNFLKNIDKFFIEEKLKQNPEFKNHLYYLIFLNYKLFKNILLSKGGIEELEKVIGEDIDDNFKAELFLSKERVKHISNINIITFKKYKILLENFMNLLK